VIIESKKHDNNIYKSVTKFIINNHILKKAKVTFSYSVSQCSFHDLKSWIIESEMKFVVISLAI